MTDWKAHAHWNGQLPLAVVLGTKGDVVKMAPVLRELDARRVRYTYVHTSQHREATLEVGALFGLREPDVWLSGKPGAIRTLGQMAKWVSGCAVTGLRLGRRIWPVAGGWVMVHGDTESTMLGAALGRRFGQRIMHVEAGLRSLSLRDPFPEELHRIVADRMSDVLFAPDSVAASYVRRNDSSRRIVTTHGNTVFDALAYVLARGTGGDHGMGGEGDFAIATVHRKETLYSRSRLRFAVWTVLEAARRRRVAFVMHENTRHALVKRGLLDVLAASPNVELWDRLLTYEQFIHAVNDAEFVITDGGGLQEETWWLDKPCLLLRRRTERQFGLGETAALGYFDTASVRHFLSAPQEFRRRGGVHETSPSRVVADEVQRLVAG